MYGFSKDGTDEPRYRELNPVLCGNTEGWNGVGDRREVQEGGDICIPVADSC